MKCVSSCFSCLCGTKNSSRVSPAESPQVVQIGESPARVISVVGEEGEGGRTNPNFILGDDRGSTSGSRKSSLLVKALYIEVGKDRLLRVIHIPCSENTDGSKASTPGRGSLTSEEATPEKVSEEKSPVEKVLEGDVAGGDDEEDEYWFSKWARKPRFKSIFAKNPDQRPKLHNSGENNNNSMNSEENNKLSAELEMKRAAAAAKRRAWAYNNNGNGDMTVTQQPTVNTSDEEEFSSIAIVNSTKQQWSKNGSSTEENDSGGNPFKVESPEKEGEHSNSNPFEQESSPGKTSNPFELNSPKSTCSSVVHVEVSIEKQNGKSGISNPAFQDDEEEEDSENIANSSSQKIVKIDLDKSPTLRTLSNATSSTASVKSRSSSSDEDIISSHSDEGNVGEQGKQEKRNTPLGTPPSGYTLNTTPKKPLLFFIHSVAGSSDVWHHQMEFFQQLGYEIVVPDLLGHGLSSTPLNPKYYMFESIVQDLILIFDHFTKEDMKVVLVGHGYGASLAAMLTRVRLKNVALFIAIAGGGPTPLVRRTCCQDSWMSWKCKLFHSNRIRGRFDNPELKHVLPRTIHENILLGQVWVDGDSAFYRRITVPTLLVYGMRDKVVTLVEECEMERSIPKSFLELIENAGHQIMQEAPDKLNKMLYKFISSWS